MHRTLRAGLVVVAMLAASTVSAAQRTFVSVIKGVDNPTCSTIAPCRSFAAAITATSPDGEVIVLDSGGYGPVIITQPVSIVAPSGVYAGISAFSGDGVTINVPGGVVRLVGLTINGLGGLTGISVLAADRVSIERCQTTNMSGFGIFGTTGGLAMEIKDSLAANNGAGGFGKVGGSVLIVNSQFLSNTGDGVGANDGAIVILRDVDASRNSNGGASAHAGAGITRLEIEGRTFTRNTNGGVGAFATGFGFATLNVTRTTISANIGIGIAAATSGGSAYATVVATANAVSENGTGLTAAGTNAAIMATGNSVSGNTNGAYGQLGGQVYVGGDNSIGFNLTNIGASVFSYTRN